MKDFSEHTYRSERPAKEAKEAVSFCLEQLFKDKKKQATNMVACNCTYEELIGALLLAEDEL